MPDIFISYSRKNKRRVERISEALQSEGFDLWWDKHIEAGEKFRPMIQHELNAAKCVMVLWSKHSIKSSWVLQESTQALENGLLVPVLLESVTPPMPFGEIQNADLSHWKGNKSDPDFLVLVKTLRRKTSSYVLDAKNTTEAIEEVSTNDRENLHEVISDKSFENEQVAYSLKKTKQSIIKRYWKSALLGLGTVMMTSFGVVGGYLDFKQFIKEVFGTPTISIEQSAKRDLQPNESFSITYEAPSTGYLSLWIISPDGSVERKLPLKIMNSSSVPSIKQVEPMRFRIKDIGTSYFVLLWTSGENPQHLGTYEYRTADNFDAAIKTLANSSKVAQAKTRVGVIPKQ